MSHHDHKIEPNPPQIRLLDEGAINRIAAGEVVERPASAVKELVENALDAGASRIEIDIADGGKRLIQVVDDGCGIAPGELELAVSRHATSKIDGSDLLNILSFGFRGEALASLGAVGRLVIKSRVQGREGAEISVTAGHVEPTRPAALNQGTRITLRDLFYATPARLKFMRSDRAETQAIVDVVKRLSMTAPSVAFALRDVTSDTARELFAVQSEHGDLFDALRARLGSVIGRGFIENAVPVDAEREGISLLGFAGLPTYSRGRNVAQFVFVNGRPVRDKQLLGAIRAAYSDLISRDRHPAVALFVECDPVRVDVNVHPAKSDVRFREPGVVRGLIISTLRHALAEVGHRGATTLSEATLGSMQAEPTRGRVYQMDRPSYAARQTAQAMQAPAFQETAPVFARVEEPAQEVPTSHPLGAAKGQVHENYIIAQTDEGIVIVDQHAAHERLVYERLKTQMAENGVAAQALLIPDVIELSATECDRLLSQQEALARIGLGIEPFGGTAVAVRETPALLGQVDAMALIRDILDELADGGATTTVQDRLDAILSRVACHGSVRSGRQMRADEMNALLRDMEATPYSGQCNHGRPTYVTLKLSDIERLFGRT